MTTLVVADTRLEAVAMRGPLDRIVVTLEQLRSGITRGRAFGSVQFTRAANARANDDDRALVEASLVRGSGGVP